MLRKKEELGVYPIYEWVARELRPIPNSRFARADPPMTAACREVGMKTSKPSVVHAINFRILPLPDTVLMLDGQSYVRHRQQAAPQAGWH